MIDIINKEVNIRLDGYKAFAALGISHSSYQKVMQAENELSEIFHEIDSIEAANQAKVLAAFWQERIAQHHFAPTSGYGYNDLGRDALDRVFAHVFDCEDALVRPQFASGTHALYCVISGLLLPGDTLLSITSSPYDTVRQAIGISGNAEGTLIDFGIKYKQVDLTPEGKLDLPAILAALDSSVKVVYLQRSRGYSWRKALSVEDMCDAFSSIHKHAPDAYILVDNCYGEFTELYEPTHAGADVLAGSLIKNPGGGLAPTGGYIVGRQECIEKIANRFTAPGIGKEVGSYSDSYRPYFQGLFLAPHVTAQSLKTAALFSKMLEDFGLETLPLSTEKRCDIIQSVRFKNAESLIAFCRSIQKASPVDSYVSPEPWDMPGYDHQVIMAAGTFVHGASIELSADGPMSEPYTAYFQGALTLSHGRIACMMALDALTGHSESN